MWRLKKSTLAVTGMHCASCANNIQKALEKKEGVKYSNVNFATSKASIEYNEKKLSENDLINLIKQKGFSASTTIDHRKQAILQKKEIKNLKFKFYLSLIFAVPAFIIGMVFMWINFMLPFQDYILWALATPVQFYVGWQFYKGTWAALKNKNATMDTLIAVGTSAAYFFSVYAILFNPSLGQYFETSAMLITLVVLGKLLEAIARGKTS